MSSAGVYGAIAAVSRRRTVVYDAETDAWIAGVVANGGGFAADSKAIADALIVQIKAATFNTKILYLLPFLGTGVLAAQVPLRNLGGGSVLAANTDVVNADFSQATGVQFDGVTKRFNTHVTTAQLRAGTDFGGMGFWERNQQADGQNACGARGAQLWRIYYDTSTPRTLPAWPTGNPAAYGASGNFHIYLQSKDATDCSLYTDGVKRTTQVTNTGASTGSNDFYVGAVDGSFLGKVRAGVFYLTDGTLTDGEVTAFHTLLNTYLITATGR